MKNMKLIAAIAATIAMTLSSCSNAGAKTDIKKEAKKGVTELNTESFNTKVFNTASESPVFLGDRPAIVDFTASWCGPCQRIAPVLEELSHEYGDRLVIYKVDIDKNRELAAMFKVSSIPAILYIPMKGEPVMTVGSRTKAQFMKEIGTFLLIDE